VRVAALWEEQGTRGGERGARASSEDKHGWAASHQASMYAGKQMGNLLCTEHATEYVGQVLDFEDSGNLGISDFVGYSLLSRG
jgi:hypothetical protein